MMVVVVVVVMVDYDDDRKKSESEQRKRGQNTSGESLYNLTPDHPPRGRILIHDGGNLLHVLAVGDPCGSIGETSGNLCYSMCTRAPV